MRAVKVVCTSLSLKIIKHMIFQYEWMQEGGHIGRQISRGGLVALQVEDILGLNRSGSFCST